MALRRGLRAIHEIKTEQDNRGGDSRRFILKGGESAVVRFYGNFELEEAPITGDVHYVRSLPQGRQYHNCGDNTDAPCVFCHEMRTQKDIKKQKRAYFDVKDNRKQHVLDQEVRILAPGVVLRPGQMGRPEDYITTKYVPCYAPQRICQYCQQGNQAKLRGYCYWELAVTYADQLTTQQSELRNYCLCGGRNEDGTPTLAVVGYFCGNCSQPVEFFPEQGHPVAYCQSCRNSLPPLESIDCTNCSEPKRADLGDFNFRVSRTGTGTDTTYNFEAIFPVKPSTAEELEEQKKYAVNFEELLSSDPPEMQAATLNVANPFPATPGHGATPYGQQPQTGMGTHPARNTRGETRDQSSQRQAAAARPVVPPQRVMGPPKSGSGQAMLEELATGVRPRPLMINGQARQEAKTAGFKLAFGGQKPAIASAPKPMFRLPASKPAPAAGMDEEIPYGD